MPDKSPDLAETYIAADRADAWEREKRRRQETSGAATAMLIKLADLKLGHRALEVAAGTGDQALMISRSVGATGQVVAVDISPNMLAYAEKAAREAGLTNIETAVMTAPETGV